MTSPPRPDLAPTSPQAGHQHPRPTPPPFRAGWGRGEVCRRLGALTLAPRLSLLVAGGGA
jgi:hypothetical protein